MLHSPVDMSAQRENAAVQVSLNEFARARRRSVWNMLRRVARGLPSLQDYLNICPQQTRHHVGLRTVPIEQIVGTVGRSRDFDARFMPRQNHTQMRWISIHRAYVQDTPLPPVELVKVNDDYYVIDGHHRVSVARVRDQIFIEADVVEVVV